MASYGTVRKAAQKAVIEGVDHEQAYPIYEAGMIDVLTQIAILRLLELDDQGRRPYPPEYDKAVEEHGAVLKKITEALPEEHKKLRHDLEGLETQISGIEMEDQFIHGFVEGYRYLRNLSSSYRGPLLDIRK